MDDRLKSRRSSGSDLDGRLKNRKPGSNLDDRLELGWQTPILRNVGRQTVAPSDGRQTLEFRAFEMHYAKVEVTFFLFKNTFVSFLNFRRSPLPFCKPWKTQGQRIRFKKKLHF